MIRKIIVIVVVVLSLNFFAFPAYCDAQPVSVEFRFLCPDPSPDCDKMQDVDSQKELFLQKQVQLSLMDLKEARPEIDWQSAYPATRKDEKSLFGETKPSEPSARILLTFREESSRKLARMTANSIGKRLGIVIDGKLLMAPNILESINDGRVEITGVTITKSAALDIANRINNALGITQKELPKTTMPENGSVILFAALFGLLLGWGIIRFASLKLPNFIPPTAGKSLKDSVKFLFTDSEMQKRLGITVVLAVLIRLALQMPLPFIDMSVLKEYFERFAYLNGFPASNKIPLGAMSKMTILGLGLMPFFSSCVILQLGSIIIPFLRKLTFGEQAGRQLLAKYTIGLTVIISAVQAYFVALWLEKQNFGGAYFVTNPGIVFQLSTVFTITAAVLLLLFLANIINKYGIGNGIAVISVSFLSPTFAEAIQVILVLVKAGKLQPILITVFLALFVVLVYLVFRLTRFSHQIEAQGAGGKVNISLRPTLVGTQPIIIAQAIFLFPFTIVSLMNSSPIQHSLKIIYQNFFFWHIVMPILVVVLVYLYGLIVFDPKYIKSLMSRYGYSLGSQLNEDALDDTMSKVMILTAIALAIVSILPSAFTPIFKIPHLVASLFGASMLLIPVGVFSDIFRQVEFHKEKTQQAAKEWDVCYVAFDEIEATIKSDFLKNKGIPALVEPLRFSWGMPIRTMVDQYNIYAPREKKEEARSLLSTV